MKKIEFIISLLVLSFLSFVSCNKEETVPETIMKSTQEEFQVIIENLQQTGNALYFTRMLYNADLQFNDTSKLTVFVIADNPYNRNISAKGETYLKNHIVKGAYSFNDFITVNKLTALSGKELEIKNINAESGTFKVNNTTAFKTVETEIDGNIIHYVYSPIFCDESDVTDYFDETKKEVARFLEYVYHFDAIFTDLSYAVNSSWIEIDNHTFSTDNEKIEKLWFDAFRILNRAVNMTIYEPQIYTDYFSENRLFQITVTSHLLNYFGGIPLYTNPQAFRNQLPRASEGEIVEWITDISERIILRSENATIQNASRAVSARLSFLQGGLVNYFQADMLTKSIINSGLYDLEQDSMVIYTESSAENVFFVTNPQTINSEIAASKTILPVSRLSESYLVGSYSAMMEGNYEGLELLKYYQQKKGHQVLDDSATFEEVNEKLMAYFLAEFIFDGIRFPLLKKFNLAEEVLRIPGHMKVLPIPMKVVTNNPNILQNPGY